MKRSNPDPCTTPTKKSRVRLTILQKREILTKLKNGTAVSALAAQYGVGLQTVRDIKKKEAEIYRYEITFSSPSSSSRKSLHRPRGAMVDEATYTWFRSQRAVGNDVSSLMLMSEAKRLKNKNI